MAHTAVDTMSTSNPKEIEDWMTAVAQRRQPKKTLIFDKETKRLVAVDPVDPRIDRSIPFTTKEATRYALDFHS